jgi:hypothetical protein
LVLQPSDGAALNESGNRCRRKSERPPYTNAAEGLLVPVDPLAAYTQPLGHLLDLEESVRYLRGSRGGLGAEDGEELLPRYRYGRSGGQALSDEPQRGPVLGRHRTA